MKVTKYAYTCGSCTYKTLWYQNKEDAKNEMKGHQSSTAQPHKKMKEHSKIEVLCDYCGEKGAVNCFSCKKDYCLEHAGQQANVCYQCE